MNITGHSQLAQQAQIRFVIAFFLSQFLLECVDFLSHGSSAVNMILVVVICSIYKRCAGKM
jgi:hypothetical protein